MPELPEVEACRRLAARHCTGKRIKTAQTADDDKVIEGIEPVKLQAALEGRTVKQAHRKGKHMWIEFDSGPCLMLHFGMTGSLVVKGVKSHQYKSFKVDGSDWPPKYWKVVLELEEDVSLAFSDARRFARVRLQEDPASHEPVSLLGFDPVLSMPSLEDLSKSIKQQKRSLKALLLDQAFSAGIGNWVADEVLYQAKLHPEAKANSLTDAQIEDLHKAIKYVPEAAVEAEADHERFPPDWLFHVRWDGKKKSPQLNGNAVEFLKVGGRTTAYVPAVQKPPSGAAASQPKGRAKGKRKAESEPESEEAEEEKDKAEEAKPVPSSAKAARGNSKAASASQAEPAAAGAKKRQASKAKAAPKAKRKVNKATVQAEVEEEEEGSNVDTGEEESGRARKVSQTGKSVKGNTQSKAAKQDSGKGERDNSRGAEGK
ncbi:hypothetical protein WJX82_005296 [Trebouxia sp. C0006]